MYNGYSRRGIIAPLTTNYDHINLTLNTNQSVPSAALPARLLLQFVSRIQFKTRKLSRMDFLWALKRIAMWAVLT